MPPQALSGPAEPPAGVQGNGHRDRNRTDGAPSASRVEPRQPIPPRHRYAEVTTRIPEGQRAETAARTAHPDRVRTGILPTLGQEERGGTGEGEEDDAEEGCGGS